MRQACGLQCRDTSAYDRAWNSCIWEPRAATDFLLPTAGATAAASPPPPPPPWGFLPASRSLNRLSDSCESRPWELDNKDKSSVSCHTSRHAAMRHVARVSSLPSNHSLTAADQKRGHCIIACYWGLAMCCDRQDRLHSRWYGRRYGTRAASPACLPWRLPLG